MKVYIVRHKKTKQIYSKYGVKIFIKRSTPKGVITQQRKYKYNKDYIDFWENAEVVECELVIPE